MLTFAQAQVVVASAPIVREFFGDGFTVANYGWQNEAVFVLAVHSADGAPMFDAPELLVDKATGELHAVFGLLGADPAPGLVPVNLASSRP